MPAAAEDGTVLRPVFISGPNEKVCLFRVGYTGTFAPPGAGKKIYLTGTENAANRKQILTNIAILCFAFLSLLPLEIK